MSILQSILLAPAMWLTGHFLAKLIYGRKVKRLQMLALAQKIQDHDDRVAAPSAKELVESVHRYAGLQSGIAIEMQLRQQHQAQLNVQRSRAATLMQQATFPPVSKQQRQIQDIASLLQVYPDARELAALRSVAQHQERTPAAPSTEHSNTCSCQSCTPTESGR